MAELIFTLQPMLEQAPGNQDRVSCKHCSLRVTQAGAILEWLYPVERTHAEDPSDGLPSASRAPHWSRESVKRKEQQRHSIPLCHIGIEELGVNLSLSRRGRGGKTFSLVFISHYSTIDSQVTFLKSSLFSL